MITNTYISYPGHGLGRIEKIETKFGQEFMSIHILDSGLKIFLPKSSAHLVRPLMSQETAAQVRNLMAFPNGFQTKHTPRNGKRRLDLYITKIKSNDAIKIAEVVAELNNRKHDGEQLSFGERKCIEAAKSLLLTELKLVGK